METSDSVELKTAQELEKMSKNGWVTSSKNGWVTRASKYFSREAVSILTPQKVVKLLKFGLTLNGHISAIFQLF